MKKLFSQKEVQHIFLELIHGLKDLDNVEFRETVIDISQMTDKNFLDFAKGTCGFLK